MESDSPAVIVNLAGKNLGEDRWNSTVKQQITDSRVNTTRKVVDYIAGAGTKPSLLINGSAVGYYGARGDEAIPEDAGPGDEFQSLLCQRWEETALQAEQYGVRVCISRTGVVLGRGGGALSGLVPMFKKGMGAVAGKGNQWMPWIHMDDLINIFLTWMGDTTLSGVFNNTSPQPVTNREFAKALGEVLHRPVYLRVPAAAMYLMYGELARLYVTGQQVIPARLQEYGFRFQFPDIHSAMKDAVQQVG